MISFTDRGKRGGVEQDRVCETVEPATALGWTIYVFDMEALDRRDSDN